MSILAFILLIILVWLIFGRQISAWSRTFMAHRAEDAVRRMMGMPSRREERKARERAERAARSADSSYSHDRYRQSAHSDNDPIIPKEYAEDVEYVEIRDYSYSRIIKDDNEGRTVYHESQVEEAQIIEIKD